jgi:hypothetical protein
MNRFIGFPVVGGFGSWPELKRLKPAGVQLVPFAEADFDVQIGSNLLFEGIRVWIRRILVSVTVESATKMHPGTPPSTVFSAGGVLRVSSEL